MMQIERKGVMYILVSCVWLAWLCSILIVSQCNFMTTMMTTTRYSNIFTDFSDPNNKNNNNNINDDNTELIRTVQKSYGLFSRPYYDDYDDAFLGCIRYSSKDTTTTEKDTKFRTGQAFGLITVLLLTASSIISSGIVLINFFHRTTDHDIRPWRPILWRVALYLSISAAITQLFTFIALGSTEKCYLDNNNNNDDEFHSALGGCAISATAKLAIFNTVLLDGICLLWFFVTIPDTPLLQVRLYVSTNSTDVNEVQQSLPDRQDSHRNNLVIVNHTEVDYYVEDTESLVPECTNTESNILDHHPLPIHESSSQDDNRATESSTSTMKSHLQLYHFQYQLITVLLNGIVWMVSILGVQRCTLVVAIEAANVDDNYDDNTANLQNQQQYRSGIGLYQMAIHDEEQHFLGCVAYPSHMIHDTFDSTFRAARAFGAITTLVTSSTLMLSILLLFRTKSMSMIASLVTRMFLLLSIVLEASTFAIFRSEVCNTDGEVSCQLGGTGKLIILNLLLMVVVSVLLHISPTPREPLLEMVPTYENGKNLKSFVSIVPKKTIKETLSNFRIDSRKETRQSDINDMDDEISTDCSGTIPLDKNLNDDNDLFVTSVVIQVEYSDTEKTTRKIITYQDGTQTIHTTIEEMYEEDDEIADFEVNDNVEYLE